MKLLKVFNKGLVSPYQNMEYKKGKQYICNNFDTSPVRECSNGFYAADWDGLTYAYRQGKQVYEVEVSGKSVEINQFKRRYEKIEIGKRLTLPQIKQGLKDASDKADYDLYSVSFPFNPLFGKPKKATQKEIDLILRWASVSDSVWDYVWDSVRDSVGDSVGDSVWDSVWDSVRDSVGDSVRASVRASVWNSVWNSVGASVWDSVGAYISSMFPNIDNWKCVSHKKGINPYQPCIDLWLSGFVPSFDGKIWRLHSGKNAKIIWEED